jgi:hypothetical protein
MRRRLGVYFLTLAATTLIGVTVAAPAQAANTIQNDGTNYCLSGNASDTPTVYTDSFAVDPNTNLCTANTDDQWIVQPALMHSSTLCVQSHCGTTVNIIPRFNNKYCLSQNNAGNAYLTPCTWNDYQTWIEYEAAGTPPNPVLTYLIDYGSVDGTGTVWCLSSNFTPPPGFPSGTGTVYTTGFTVLSYHQWFIVNLP